MIQFNSFSGCLLTSLSLKVFSNRGKRRNYSPSLKIQIFPIVVIILTVDKYAKSMTLGSQSSQILTQYFQVTLVNVDNNYIM